MLRDVVIGQRFFAIHMIFLRLSANDRPGEFCFFFSSRRRHTSSLCDWSSDVCYSDLGWYGGALTFYSSDVIKTLQRQSKTNLQWYRSEERRVGKECRSRWSRYH